MLIGPLPIFEETIATNIQLVFSLLACQSSLLYKADLVIQQRCRYAHETWVMNCSSY